MTLERRKEKGEEEGENGESSFGGDALGEKQVLARNLIWRKSWLHSTEKT